MILRLAVVALDAGRMSLLVRSLVRGDRLLIVRVLLQLLSRR